LMERFPLSGKSCLLLNHFLSTRIPIKEADRGIKVAGWNPFFRLKEAALPAC
jgi:hypothetical protein